VAAGLKPDFGVSSTFFFFNGLPRLGLSLAGSGSVVATGADGVAWFSTGSVIRRGMGLIGICPEAGESELVVLWPVVELLPPGNGVLLAAERRMTLPPEALPSELRLAFLVSDEG
jgi:hypothetical protein